MTEVERYRLQGSRTCSEPVDYTMGDATANNSAAPRLPQRLISGTHGLLLPVPPSRAGRPGEVQPHWRVRAFAQDQAESCAPAERGRASDGKGYAICAPLTLVFATGSTPVFARRRAMTGAWPLVAAA